MSTTPPETLSSLLASPSGLAREAAWAAFLEEHSALILHVARSQGGDHDVVMDRYLHVIQALQDQDCRRLRIYVEDRQCRFTTWLIVVVRRLCFDHYRARYGRPQSDTDAAAARRNERRQLIDLVGSELQLELLESGSGNGPEEECRLMELRSALGRALTELSPDERLLLRLRYEDGVSVPEMSRVLGEASPFAMYRRLDKLLVRLRRSLTAAGIEDPVP
jgi:RNA polymerase sigma factor (sigma-70 family)